MIATANQTRHYTPATWTVARFPAILAAAYRLAGKVPPTMADDCRRLLDAEPTAAQVAEECALAALEKGIDPADWLAASADRMHRAQAADSLRSAMARHAESALNRNAGRFANEAAHDLTPAFNKAAKRLTAAAEKLPAGDSPFDLAAIVEADATAAMKEAGAALVDLATIAAIFRPRGHEAGPEVGQLVTVVAFPAVPQQERNRMTGTLAGEGHPQRDAVRQLVRDAERHGLDRALIGVARGEYDGASLRLAESHADLEANRQRAWLALSTKGVDTWR